MLDKRSVIAGMIGGGIVLGFGLALIFAKDWAWSLFVALYSMLGIQAEQTRLWEMFITTIGLGVSAVGFSLIWSVWKRRRTNI
ncbi:MAG: hypothetical protein ACK2U5_24615 [Candidatus Promineifilaceae bacterium]|jgi:hypothetical protein